MEQENTTRQKSPRTPRSNETRAAEARKEPWKPPSMLDAPPAPEGYKHRWIRTEVRGQSDTKNMSSRLREGYAPVRADEYPDFEAPTIEDGRHAGCIGVGGLILARIPLETVDERAHHFNLKTEGQMDAVDNDYFRDGSHPSMSVSKPNRQSRVTLGGKRAADKA